MQRNRATAVCCAYAWKVQLCSYAHSISDITSFGCRDEGHDSVCPVLWMPTCKKFKKARVNGGSNYNSLKDSHKSLRCRWQTRTIW